MARNTGAAETCGPPGASISKAGPSFGRVRIYLEVAPGATGSGDGMPNMMGLCITT